MLKILHLCDQNWVGTASTFVKYHNRLGNYSRMVTLSRCRTGFDEDICLDLPLMQGGHFDMALKRVMSLLHANAPKNVDAAGVRQWRPRSGFEGFLFTLRDTLAAPKIYKAIDRYDLLSFDIYHLESGVEFFRDARIIKKLKAMGKRIVCYYLGTDLRDRGVIPDVDRLSDLNITTEFDHLRLRPGLRFSFLPFEVDAYVPRQTENKRLRICHAPRNRLFKGTERIIQVCKEMERKHDVELVLIEGRPHQEAIEIKKTCDIAIDIIVDIGGTGYGVNSLETLSMGIPTLTSFTPEFEAFLPDHPFIIVNPENLGAKLEQVILDRDLRRRKAQEGRQFVEKYHQAEKVVRSIYAIYKELGWMDDAGNYVPRAGGSWQRR
ncbi:MAG TPA: glycosyltransferase [bacterium]|nr:glycosyltransferase [bacterium]